MFGYILLLYIADGLEMMGSQNVYKIEFVWHCVVFEHKNRLFYRPIIIVQNRIFDHWFYECLQGDIRVD